MRGFGEMGEKGEGIKKYKLPVIKNIYRDCHLEREGQGGEASSLE